MAGGLRSLEAAMPCSTAFGVAGKRPRARGDRDMDLRTFRPALAVKAEAAGKSQFRQRRLRQG